jgi:hypothetical protein
MKLTNKLRLPEVIVDAVQNDSYTKGEADISVTELLTPPQLRHLKLKYADEIVEDVSDRIYSLLGQSMHVIIERASAGKLDALSETTVYSDYDGWTVKGQADHILLATGELLDFKMTSVYKIKDGQVPREWVEQTNIYRRLLQREKGLVVNSIAIIVVLRDWSKNKSKQTQDYPQAQVVRLDVPLWDERQTDDFISQRIRLHQAAEPAPCSDYDMWAKPDTFAVMKRGNVRAVRVFNNRFDADVFASTSSGLYVELRPGDAIRCQEWCPVSHVCPQWRDDPRNKKTLSIEEKLFDA